MVSMAKQLPTPFVLVIHGGDGESGSASGKHAQGFRVLAGRAQFDSSLWKKRVQGGARCTCAIVVLPFSG